MPVLAASNLRKLYGTTVAVEDVSFAIEAGETVGLLGPNGAGKTTTINMILGVLEPTAGSVTIEGLDVMRQRSAALQLTNFAAVYAPLPGNLTVVQNLMVFARVYGVRNRQARVSAVIDEFDLGRFRDVKCGVLSSGEQTRVSLAKAMLNEPRLLLLDEPLEGLAPLIRAELLLAFERLSRESGVTVVIVEQQVQEVLRYATRALILERGAVVHAAAAAELIEDAATLERLVGMAVH